MWTIDEFANQIKQQYPTGVASDGKKYSDMGPEELTNRVVKKYPVYSKQIQGYTDTTAEKPAEKTSFLKGEITGQPQDTGFLGKLAQETIGSKGVLGSAQLLGKSVLSAGAIKEQTGLNESAAGLAEVTTKAIQAKRNLTDPERIAKYDRMIAGNIQTLKDMGENVAELEKYITKPKEAIATTLRAAATVAPVGKGLSVAQRIGAMGATGMAYGAATPIEQGQPAGEVVKQSAIGGGIGLATGGLLEGIGAAWKALRGSDTIKKGVGNLYNKELQPSIKNVTSSIQRGVDTFGERVSKMTDDAGNAIYVGSPKNMLNSAKEQIAQNMPIIESEVQKMEGLAIPKSEIIGDIQSKLESEYSSLNPRQLQQLNFEMSRIPETVNGPQLLSIKRGLDNQITASFWNKLLSGDAEKSFSNYLKYQLRDKIKDVLNEKSGSELLQKANNAVHTAIDVSSLSARQIAKGVLKPIGQKLVPRTIPEIFSKILDNTIFNPKITTRVGQGLMSAEQKTGQTLPRVIGRKILTKGIEQATESSQ